MISLHKLDGREVVVNAELIESVEPGGQTVVTLTTGNKYLVKETPEEVSAKVVEYRRKVAGKG